MKQELLIEKLNGHDTSGKVGKIYKKAGEKIAAGGEKMATGDESSPIQPSSHSLADFHGAQPFHVQFLETKIL